MAAASLSSRIVSLSVQAALRPAMHSDADCASARPLCRALTLGSIEELMLSESGNCGAASLALLSTVRE